MTYPNVSIGTQFTDGEDVDAVELHARIDVPFDAIRGFAQDTGWTVPSLGNSWASLTGWTVCEYRLKGGWVIIEGVIHSGTTSTTIFTLPVGMRPLAPIQRPATSGTGGAQIAITAAGAVSVAAYTGTGSNAAVGLGVIFIAEQ